MLDKTTALVRYDTACRALAEARSVDEVKDILDKAVAIQAYARQAENKDLEADAFEIRKRAERRLGELMDELPKAKRAGPGRGRKGEKAGLSENPAFEDLGIDKNLANRARQAADMPDAEFEAHVAAGREDVRRSVERAEASKHKRKQKHEAIATKAAARATLECLGPFPLIYADPPWKWGHFGEQDMENEAGKGRTPDQHYPTLTLEEIKEFRVEGKRISEIAHRDSALFLWCTTSNLMLALEVMIFWGFVFKTSAAWDKQRKGMGLVFRNQHELLLYGTRGNMPGPQYQPPSLFSYPRGKHSEKPREIRAAIEKMYPDFDKNTRLELFPRERVKGWSVYGYESD